MDMIVDVVVVVAVFSAFCIIVISTIIDVFADEIVIEVTKIIIIVSLDGCGVGG